MPLARRLPHPFVVALAACLLLSLGLTGCGRRGREAAQEKIKASRHEFTANDFVKAAADGDRALVEAFLQGGIDHNAPDARGWTAVMAAAAGGHVDVLKAILDDNAKADLINKDGKSALGLAAENNQPEAARALIEANADVRLRDRDGITPLMRAIQSGHERVVEVFLATSRDALARDGQLDRGLAVAATLGRTRIVGQLLDRGAKINVTVEDRKTPLMLAAEYGQRETVEYLLTRGADARLTDQDGADASVIALGKHFPEIAKILDARAPVTGATTAGGSPTPAVSPVGSAPPALASPAPNPAQAREQAWLREQGLKPEDVLKRDTGQDDDHDGFSNDEELAAGTDPNNPDSHPPYYTKLRLAHVDGTPFPVVFDGTARGDRVMLTVSGRSGVEVETGSKIPGTPYRVERVRRRNISEKDTARPLDVSELTLINTETRKTLVLVKGMASQGTDTHATLRFLIDGSEVTVRQGEDFNLPRDPATHFTVMEIRSTQVVLKIAGTSKTVTIEK